MPIHCPIKIRPLSDAAFAEIDRVVMSCAYASQNTLGRLCDERVYESDLAARLISHEISEVHTQVPVTVTHSGFSKIYRLDFVVRQMVYELKTVTLFGPEHDTQTIHYGALLDTDRVKLLNFRTPKVIGKLNRCPFPNLNRKQVRYDDHRWKTLSDQCERLKEQMQALLADWGAFLEASLYEEALIHFSGGENFCARRLPVIRDGLELGTHRLPCHAEHSAYIVTALTAGHAAYEQHLCRLLQFTRLQGLQWINLNHSDITFVTLRNGKGMEAKE